MSQRMVGFVQVEELPPAGRHRKDEPSLTVLWRLSIFSDDSGMVAYRRAPSPPDALWAWLVDQLWNMSHDAEWVDDVIDRFGVKVLSETGRVGADLTTDIALYDLTEEATS